MGSENGRVHVERSMGPMIVVVRDIDAQSRHEMTSSADEDPVEALTPERADEPLGERIGEWRLDRGADDP
jgi:hypothetical protein